MYLFFYLRVQLYLWISKKHTAFLYYMLWKNGVNYAVLDIVGFFENVYYYTKISANLTKVLQIFKFVL